MFKKTKVRKTLELLHKNLSAREIARVLSVLRNSVSYVHNELKKEGATEMLL